MNAESDKDVIFTNFRNFFKLQSIFRTKKTTQDSSPNKIKTGICTLVNAQCEEKSEIQYILLTKKGLSLEIDLFLAESTITETVLQSTDSKHDFRKFF